jgi:hypothetical protein
MTHTNVRSGSGRGVTQRLVRTHEYIAYAKQRRKETKMTMTKKKKETKKKALDKISRELSHHAMKVHRKPRR